MKKMNKRSIFGCLKGKIKLFDGWNDSTDIVDLEKKEKNMEFLNKEFKPVCDEDPIDAVKATMMSPFIHTLEMPHPISNNVYYRRTSHGTYLSIKAVMYKRDIKILNMQWKLKPTEDDIAMGITIHPKLTKKGVASKICMDIDNYFKCIMDSLIDILYIDDEQVKRYDYVEFGEPKIDGGVTIKWRVINHG